MKYWVAFAAAFFLVAAHAGPVPAGWTPFWQEFRMAVAHEDRTTLRTLMSARVNVENSAGEGADATFQDLDDGGGGAWKDLKTAMSLKPHPTKASTAAKPQMEVYAKRACSSCKYGVEVVFEREADGWKWIAMNFPGD